MNKYVDVSFGNNLPQLDWIQITEAEFQLPLKGFSDPAAESIVGWRQEKRPATKTCFKFPRIDNCLMVTK